MPGLKLQVFIVAASLLSFHSNFRYPQRHFGRFYPAFCATRLRSKGLILTLLICFCLENCFKPLCAAHRAVLADGQRVQRLLMDSAIQCRSAHQKQEEGLERNTYVGVRYFNWSPNDALVHRWHCLVSIDHWIYEVRGKSQEAQTKDFKSVLGFINYLTECPLALQSLSRGEKGLVRTAKGRYLCSIFTARKDQMVSAVGGYRAQILWIRVSEQGSMGPVPTHFMNGGSVGRFAPQSQGEKKKSTRASTNLFLTNVETI